MIRIKRITAILCLALVFALPRLRAQDTTKFNFSLTAKPVSGWVNVIGDPVTAVRTATRTSNGISISSVATANWSAYLGSCAKDSNGSTGGTFFPAAVMLNNWFQYSTTLANYNAAVPQLIISGLNIDSVYTIRMTGSSISGFTSNPTQYTVSGTTVYGSISISAHNNTSTGATFNNIAPDSAGRIKIYVNTASGSQVADICGVQIIPQRTPAPIPVVVITSPDNNDILPEDGNIIIKATASETGGLIRKVEFYENGIKLGEDSVAPYTYTWVNPDEGDYILMARAIDTLGSTGSFSINVSVQSLSSFWSMTGNIAANPDSNFLGTVDTNRLAFRTNNLERMTILANGTVGIGTKNTQGYQLAVNGGAIFTKVKIKAYAGWPDYVFKKDYKLPRIDSLERYIRIHQHLPGITPASVAESKGLDIGEGQAALLKKIEELTLYLIEEHKQVQQLRQELHRMKAKMHHSKPISRKLSH